MTRVYQKLHLSRARGRRTAGRSGKSSPVWQAMAPTQLIFSSTRTDSGSETVDAILRASRTNNARDGVTGLLIVGERHFVQLLEGDRASVSRCFLRITRDARHQDLEVISTGEVPQRLFAEQSMQRIDLSSVKSPSLGRYLLDGAFQPSWLPQAAVEQLCRELSPGHVQAAPRKDLDESAEALERLRRIHQAARHVLDDNVGSKRLGRDKLEQLQASILRQACEARALQDQLAKAGADEAHRIEVADLIAYFDTILVAISRQLSA